MVASSFFLHFTEAPKSSTTQMEFLEEYFSKLLESCEQTCESYSVEVNGFDLSFSNINITGITSVTT